MPASRNKPVSGKRWL